MTLTVPTRVFANVITDWDEKAVAFATPRTLPGFLKVFEDEIANARIWAGFHYRFSTVVGQDMGHKIGRYVVENVMQPVR